MSEKNELQEYCVRHDLGLPVYESRNQGLQHQLEWYASVTIHKINKTVRTTTAAKSKVTAEKQAAGLMIQQLAQPVISIPQVHTVEYIYLIDLENKPCFRQKFQLNALYIGFISTSHDCCGKYANWHKCDGDDLKQMVGGTNYKLIYYIEGGVNDLVDHHMTLAVYPVVNYVMTMATTPTIVIVSGDHAGWCTRNCLEKVATWRNLTLKIINAASIEFG